MLRSTTSFKGSRSTANFVDLVISKTTDFLFEEIKDGFKEEFEKGNLKHPFIISSEYYLYLKLKEIKDKVVKTTKINISNEEDLLDE